MLEKEFKYYIRHQDELVEKYNGRFIVIIGEDVVGVYDDEMAAYWESQKKYSPGTYMIQLCRPGKENFTHVYHTRVD